MEIVLGLAGAMALVWLFSSTGNFKRNLRYAVLATAYLLVASICTGAADTINDHHDFAIKVGVGFFVAFMIAVRAICRADRRSAAVSGQPQRAVRQEPTL